MRKYAPFDTLSKDSQSFINNIYQYYAMTYNESIIPGDFDTFYDNMYYLDYTLLAINSKHIDENIYFKALIKCIVEHPGLFSNDTELENAFSPIRILTDRTDPNYVHGIDNKTKGTLNIERKNKEIFHKLRNLLDCMTLRDCMKQCIY